MFWFWSFWDRYRKFCEYFKKENDTLPKLDFGDWAQTEHEGTRWARANFWIFRLKVFPAPDYQFCEEFVKENDTFPK